MNRIVFIVGVLALGGLALPRPAEAQVTATDLATAFLTGRPVPTPDTAWTLDAAYAVQADLVRYLADSLGARIGYKVGLTGAATQQRFGIPHPIYGVLLTAMLFPSGTAFAADQGVRWLGEGDLVVRVADGAIHDAESRRDVLAHLDAVYPFLELPDLMYAPDAPLNGPALAAINIGARAGILGEAVPLAATDAWLKRLGEMTVALLDADGTVLSEGRGTDLMGHPLDAVLWLCEALEQAGQRLRAGDLISLGSLTRLVPIRAGMVLRVQYKGLNPASETPMEIQASFH